jgi:hypothetical protein
MELRVSIRNENLREHGCARKRTVSIGPDKDQGMRENFQKALCHQPEFLLPQLQA